MSTNPTPAPAALPELSTAPETGTQTRQIRPLGDQLIIKVVPMADKLGSIIVPDQAKTTTLMGSKGSEDAVNFVEAIVIAVGPGKRSQGDPKLVDDLWNALLGFPKEVFFNTFIDRPDAIRRLGERVHETSRLPLTVKPGDRILYHPSVQKFDRKVGGLGEGEYFIILENSVLAILEADT